MPRFAAACLLCAAVSAQIPEGHLVFVHRTPSPSVAGMGILDPDFGTLTEIVPQTGSWATTGSRTVAIDPAMPDLLYSVSSLSISIATTVPWRSDVTTDVSAEVSAIRTILAVSRCRDGVGTP